MHLGRRSLRLAAAVAVVAGFIGISAAPAAAEPILSASDVAAGLTAPTSGGATFAVTGTISNTGLFSQPAGSTLTISAVGGSVTAAPGCTISAGSALCVAASLPAGGSQSWGATVTTNAGATSVTTTVAVTAANGELNVFPDNANNSASKVTGVVYNVSAALSNNPSTVRNGDDTLLTASATNNSAPQNVSLAVNLGGVRDAQFPLPAGCTANGAGTVVTCTAAYAAGQTRSYDIAVATPTSGSSITSTATATGAIGGSGNASVVTNLFSDAQAFVPQGDCLADTLPNHSSNFCVATGSAPGLFLDLNQINLPAGTMCGTAPCQTQSAEALFPNSGTYSGSNPAKPYLWDISYGQLVCNGNGAPKCTDVLYVILSGQTTPTKMPQCQTYGQSVATLRNVNEVCLQAAIKNGQTWTFRVALLRDIAIPILSGVGK